MVLQVLQQLQHPPPAKAFSPCQRAMRIVDAKAHRGIDILRAGDAFLHRIQRFVNQHRHRAPHQQAGIIGNTQHFLALLLEVMHGLISGRRRVGCRCGQHHRIAGAQVIHHHRAVMLNTQRQGGLAFSLQQQDIV